MLHTTTLRSGDGHHRSYQASVRTLVAERLSSNCILAHYLEGWAEADPAKIADATADNYDFHDPLVGRFSRRTLPQYFALLRSRFGIAGIAATRDLAFALRGPMSSASHAARCLYWRRLLDSVLRASARSRLDLKELSARRSPTDLNLASETLRGCGPQLQ